MLSPCHTQLNHADRVTQQLAGCAAGQPSALAPLHGQLIGNIGAELFGALVRHGLLAGYLNGFLGARPGLRCRRFAWYIRKLQLKNLLPALWCASAAPIANDVLRYTQLSGQFSNRPSLFYGAFKDIHAPILSRSWVNNTQV